MRRTRIDIVLVFLFKDEMKSRLDNSSRGSCNSWRAGARADCCILHDFDYRVSSFSRVMPHGRQDILRD